MAQACYQRVHSQVAIGLIEMEPRPRPHLFLRTLELRAHRVPQGAAHGASVAAVAAVKQSQDTVDPRELIALCPDLPKKWLTPMMNLLKKYLHVFRKEVVGDPAARCPLV